MNGSGFNAPFSFSFWKKKKTQGWLVGSLDYRSWNVVKIEPMLVVAVSPSGRLYVCTVRMERVPVLEQSEERTGMNGRARY